MFAFNFPGDIHFVTTRTYKNQLFFKDEKCCELFLENLDFYRQKYDLKIFGYCIMPNHVHLLIDFDLDKHPELTISRIMHGIKSYSAKLIYDHLTGRQCPCALPENNALTLGPELPDRERFKV